MYHYENVIQCYGKILYKRYNEAEKRLFLLVGVFVPKVMRGKTEENFNHDFPGFTLTGDAAAEAAKKYEKEMYVSILAHANTEMTLTPIGGRNYRKDWLPVLIIDEIQETTDHNGFSNVIFAGEIIRIYRNAEPGRRFYMITVRMSEAPDDGNEDAERITFVYFDPQMKLEPQVGDHIYMDGIIQTKRVEDQETSRQRTLLSFVSRFVMLYRK